jgi:DNA repair exonuclease SbcCD ATPase subunit
VILREANATQLKGIEGMPWGAKNCPTCDQPVDAEKIKTLQAKLAGWVHNVDVSLAMIDQKINALGDIKGSLALIEGHNQALKELEEFETASEERLRKIEETRKDVPDATMFDFAPFNESIGGCDAEIERLSNLLRPVIVAEERAKEIEIKQGQFAALKEKAATLDRLVKYFDKGGIKAKLLGEYIGSFEYKLNDVMSAWGYSCALSIEPYSFDVTTARGDVIPVRELSGAERVMFSLAFQCAVSRTANIGIVVIDEVATFLPEIRSAMNKRLYEMIRDGSLEQAILLVADTSEQISKLPGMAFFMVDSGTVHPLVQNSVVRKEPVNERNAERSIVA